MAEEQQRRLQPVCAAPGCAAQLDIRVTNPMNNVVVYLKVIGRIPDTVYEKEVIVVLSPMAAKQLGAQDIRFFARVKYYK